MARKHNLKRNRVRQPVEQTLVTPESTERKLLLNPDTNEYIIHTIHIPAIVLQGRAKGPTKQRVPRKKGRR